MSDLRADTHGDLMSVREAVDTTSKAFATGGEDFAYYLNESKAEGASLQLLAAGGPRAFAQAHPTPRRGPAAPLPRLIQLLVEHKAEVDQQWWL